MIWGLISTLVMGEAGSYLARLKKVAGLYAAMAIFGLGLLFSLLASLYIFLAQRYGALETALGFSAGWFVLVVVAWVLVIVARKPPRKEADDRLKRDIASIAGVAALSNAGLMIKQVKRRKSLLLVPVAAVGGWALWRSIETYRQDR